MNTNKEEASRDVLFRGLLAYAWEANVSREQALKALKALKINMRPDEARDVYSLASKK